MGWVENASPAVDAQSQWRTLVTVCVVLSFMSISVVSARLWIRYRARGLAADDHMAALAMVFALAYSILCIVQTRYGLGLPIKLRPAKDLIPYTKVNFAGRPIYQLGVSFFKIALLISYLRLFQGTNKLAYRRAIWLAIVAIFLGHLGCALSLVFACDPVDKSWKPSKRGNCLAPGPSFTAYAMTTIASDIIVTLLPIPALARLNIPTSKKFGLCGVFLLGLFTTICSVLRYRQINRIQHGDGNSTMLVLWGTIEFNVGNMVSSLPFLAPVFVRKAKEYRSKQHSTSSSSRRSRSKFHSFTKGNDESKLSNTSQDKPGVAMTTSSGDSASREDILGDTPDNSIVKSVTYSVRVNDPERSDSKSGSPQGYCPLSV